MANWKEYTTKTTPEDADEIMIADTKANANKRTPFGGLWNWIAGKLATAVISQLETQSKSIIPALNELNSKSFGLLPQIINNAQPDTMSNGLFLSRYTKSTENRPSDYGVAMYITYKDGTNFWCTAIACSTNNIIYISSKTNTDSWSKWSSIASA